MKDRNIVSVTPEITDPDYLYIKVDTTIKYNSVETDLTPNNTIPNIKHDLSVWTDRTWSFSDQFRYSPLIKKIDETESSVESSLTSVKLKRTFTPTLNVSSSYTLKFSNQIPVVNGVAQLSSTQFSHEDDNGILRTGCELQDTNGTLQVFRTSGSIE